MKGNSVTVSAQYHDLYPFLLITFFESFSTCNHHLFFWYSGVKCRTSLCPISTDCPLANCTLKLCAHNHSKTLVHHCRNCALIVLLLWKKADSITDKLKHGGWQQEALKMDNIRWKPPELCCIPLSLCGHTDTGKWSKRVVEWWKI